MFRDLYCFFVWGLCFLNWIVDCVVFLLFLRLLGNVGLIILIWLFFSLFVLLLFVLSRLRIIIVFLSFFSRLSIFCFELFIVARFFSVFEFGRWRSFFRSRWFMLVLVVLLLFFLLLLGWRIKLRWKLFNKLFFELEWRLFFLRCIKELKKVNIRGFFAVDLFLYLLWLRGRLLNWIKFR